MNEFRVSVIIPVYNAEKYLRNAVESALALNEVGEIVLVEDRSPDNAWQICKELTQQYPKVKLFTHEQRANRGAGASRNLGIEKSSGEFVAFLDADDWYLPNRFKQAKRIFAGDGTVDGVYEATGFYHNESGTLLDELTTVRGKDIQPANLLYVLLQNKTGRFHTNAITLRKSVFGKSGYFDTSLRLHQDTHLWLRLAHTAKLVPGTLDTAVAIRRVHSLNRIQHTSRETKASFHVKAFEWFKNKNIDKRAYRILFKRYISALAASTTGRILVMGRLAVKEPSLFWKLM